MRKSARRTGAGPPPFDLRSLEIFLAVAEAASFTVAASRLGLTQSAVSQTVIQLESGFDVRLIDRKVKPMALTVSGTVLREHAKALIEEARRVAPAVREAAALKLPIVRVGMIDSLFPLLAPVLGVELRAFAEQFSILAGLSDPHREAFLGRSIDIIMTSDAIEDVDRLDRFPLLQEPYILLLPASRGGEHNDDLGLIARELPFIRYTERSQMGRQIARYLRRLRLEIPHSQAYDSTYGLVAMVAAGLGWAITTPLCMLDAQPSAERTLVAPLPPPGFSRRLTLVARSGELGSLPARIAVIAQHALAERCAPVVARTMPWLGKRFSVG
ncbi:MAG: LysR family transcriptional regulator [Alphaproteobacteria bacterium]